MAGRTALMAAALAATPWAAHAQTSRCPTAPSASGDVVVLSMYGGRGARVPYSLAGAEHETRSVAVGGAGGGAVTLVLSAYEPTVWDLSRIAGRVRGVVASGYYPQAVSGLPASVPVTFASTRMQEGAAGCSVPSAHEGMYEIQQQARAVSDVLGTAPRRWYGGYDPSSFDIDGGRTYPMPKAPPATAVRAGVAVRTTGLMPGYDGLQQLIAAGALRRFSKQDLDDWAARGAQLDMISGPFMSARGHDPLEYIGQASSGYLVLRSLKELPAGLNGADSAVFVLPQGVTMAAGAGHSTVYRMRGYPGIPPEGSTMVPPDMRAQTIQRSNDAAQPAVAFVEWDADGKVVRNGSTTRPKPNTAAVTPSRLPGVGGRIGVNEPDGSRDMTPSALLAALLVACGGAGLFMTRLRGDPLAGIRHRVQEEDPALAIARTTPDVEHIVDAATAAEIQKMLEPIAAAMELAFEDETSLSLLRFRRVLLQAVQQPRYDDDLASELDVITDRDLPSHLRTYLSAARRIVDGRASVLEAALRNGVDRLTARIGEIMVEQSRRDADRLREHGDFIAKRHGGHEA